MQTYVQIARDKNEILKKKNEVIILAIESSCDETAVAIVKNGREVLSNVISSQIDSHKIYGGVVPEIASRLHVEKIDIITKQALIDAKMQLQDIDALAVTNGPGLVGCLLVGVSYAKALAFSQEIPLVAVQHVQGHIAANYISNEHLKPPFVALVVSGGHSHIFFLEDYTKSILLGKTRDDAAGEALDKAARMLDLPYPGGPELEKLAKMGDENAFLFQSSFNRADHLDFSFSGLKTALINQLHQAKQNKQELNRADIAASFQKTLIDVLVQKTMSACQQKKAQTLVIAGGVASNANLRENMRVHSRNTGIHFVCPPAQLCTDNAAMIGSAAFFQLMQGDIADLTLNAQPNRKIKAG